MKVMDSTWMISLWEKEKEILKAKDFHDDAMRMAYCAFLDGFARGYGIEKKEHKENDMNRISEDYVSFETAKLLKEKGFDGCPLYRYDDCGQLWIQGGYDKTIKWHFPAPTLQMAMKWLREEHNIFIDIHTRLSLNADRDICFSYMIQQLTDTYSNKLEVSDGEWLSYEECVDAAIQYALKIIVNKIG